ncbi:MAG TPA: S8 family serine peptidase [Telluria sp.]|jgi:subtilisin family serine protease
MSDNSKDPQKKSPKSDAAAPDFPDQAGGGTSAGAVAVGNDAKQVVDLAGERQMDYLITLRRAPAFGTLGLGQFPLQGHPDIGQIHASLQGMSNVKVVRRVRSATLALLGNGPASGSHDILVVRTSANHGRVLAALAHPGLIVERDHLLGHLGDAGPRMAPGVGLRPLSVIPDATTVQFQVNDTAGRAQANCSVVLYSDAGGEAQGMTDQQGYVSIRVPVGDINHIAAIYIKPFANCWEHFRFRPALSEEAVHVVQLQPLPDFSGAGFSAPADGSDGFAGWGQRLMGLSQLAGGKTAGRGVKVAIIDSGCDNTHPALTHVKIGQDYTTLNEEHCPDPSSWTSDTMSHGTHCAGVITGNGKNGHIRGFVPEAEVHVLKLFPGGAFNSLAAALHYCIDNQIDVVNCSLGGDQTSESIEQLIESARQAGVALIVAAGNSSGPVQFPGSVPGVLCVAAIGEQGAFPDDTYHAQTNAPGTAGPNGLFPATFSCRGPQVGVCAPGVAVISSVPGGGYAAWDGTSMATPAVTGLVALVLAHHPEFAGHASPRDARRVDRVFQLIAASAAPLPLSRQQSGAGLPTVARASSQAPANGPEAAGSCGAQITQVQLEEIVREALLHGLNGIASGAPARAI